MKFLLTIFITALCFNHGLSQVDSLTLQKVDKSKLIGKYYYPTHHGFTRLKINRNGRYRERGLLYFGWIIEKGSWTIEKDSVIFIKRFNKEKPFAKREKKDDTALRVMNNNDLVNIDNNGSITRFRYVNKKKWKTREYKLN